MSLMTCMRSIGINQNALSKRYVHVSAVCNKTQAGRYRSKPHKRQYLTYEMANPPHYIAVRKSWNSWNTSNIKDGNRPSETAVEDMFIRNFMNGTWHNMFLSEVIIKRQHNMIRIAGVIRRRIAPSQVYFLLGYSEQLLSYWLHCPVKLELAAARQNHNTTYKVI